MDRDLDLLDSAPSFSYRRLWITLLASVSILAGGSLLIRTFPTSGHQGGYDAVVSRGADWVQAEVGAASGSALAACNELHHASETSPASPRYDYESFVEGCDAAVDDLLDRDVPLLSPGE